MRRRDFLGVLGGAAAWPVAARAQQPAMPVVGFLRSTPLADAMHLVSSLRQGLKEAGFTEGQIRMTIRRSQLDRDVLQSRALHRS